MRTLAVLNGQNILKAHLVATLEQADVNCSYGSKIYNESRVKLNFLSYFGQGVSYVSDKANTKNAQ